MLTTQRSCFDGTLSHVQFVGLNSKISYVICVCIYCIYIYIYNYIVCVCVSVLEFKTSCMQCGLGSGSKVTLYNT